MPLDIAVDVAEGSLGDGAFESDFIPSASAALRFASVSANFFDAASTIAVVVRDTTTMSPAASTFDETSLSSVITIRTPVGFSSHLSSFSGKITSVGITADRRTPGMSRNNVSLRVEKFGFIAPSPWITIFMASGSFLNVSPTILLASVMCVGAFSANTASGITNPSPSGMACACCGLDRVFSSLFTLTVRTLPLIEWVTSRGADRVISARVVFAGRVLFIKTTSLIPSLFEIIRSLNVPWSTPLSSINTLNGSDVLDREYSKFSFAVIVIE